ncbi:MAG: hypothetical protein M3N06_06560 [Pseudomonadota bacterium]|nr:hypothetical protein [Pseudomonadota bacterium]
MSDDKPAAEVDVTKEWRATHGQAAAATRLRIFAGIAWVVAIGGEIFGIVLLRQHKFDHGNLPLLLGILVGVAIFAIAGSLMWKAANKQDPARESDPAKFFFQNQLGAIITLIAFLPLIVLIFMDKDMDPKNKKIAGGVGAVLAVAATLIGVSWKPPSVEQYTKDMNSCAAQINAGQPTTACSPKSPPRRRTSRATARRWPKRPRTPRIPPARTWSTGSRPKAAPRSRRQRTSSTSARGSARCAARR